MTGHDSASTRRTQDAATLKGVLRAVLFSRPDTLFLVGKFDVEGELFPVVATGEMVSPVVGEEYVLTGEWVEHPRYGKQFRWSRYEIAYPSTEEGIERYLASGLVRGIGAATARRIVERFGRETIDVLNRDIERLLEVGGIGQKKLATIRASWAEQQGAAALMVFLKSHGVGTANALAIHRAYGPAAIDRVRENPYRLVDEVDGIGFPTADKIARSLGVGADDEKRLKAGVVYTVAEAARAHGHTHLPEDLCVHAAAALLEADEQAIHTALRAAVEEGKLARVGDRVSLPELLAAERTVVQSLRRLTSQGPLETDHFRVEDILRKLERSMGIAFTPVQVEAVHKSLAGPVTVLTGGPGTGKTTAVAGMVAVASELGLETALCAPTGRAAKRLSEITGIQARTIHRLLEFDPVAAEFQRDGDHPLEIDFLIVDETSMVDLPLMAALLRAVPDGARVTLLGDADQLPSVGPGNVLRDIIEAGCVETVVLRLIHRQSGQSRIVTNAHRVREGFLPVFGGDTFFVDADTPEGIASLVVDIVVRRIPREMGYDPVTDIQVLSPMYTTPAGVDHLNLRLRRELNPGGRLILHKGEESWHIGDKVMQTRNDYGKEVFNGDIGRIVDADDEEAFVTVRFDERHVVFAFDELSSLTHAYAITIHKSQGSEYNVVVLPVTMHHRIMLQRNLLYTAMTRARKLLVCVGQRSALEYGVRNERPTFRHTGLAEALREAFR